MDYGVETVKQQTRATLGCLAVSQSPWALALAMAYAVHWLCLWCTALQYVACSPM